MTAGIAERPARAEVLDWLENALARPLDPAAQADLLAATGLGPAATRALINRFSAAFLVDMSGFRIEMHHPGDHFAGGWPLRWRPTCGVVFPLSVTTFHTAARQKVWPLTYPSLSPVQNLAWLNPVLILLGLPLLTLLALWLLPRLV